MLKVTQPCLSFDNPMGVFFFVVSNDRSDSQTIPEIYTE